MAKPEKKGTYSLEGFDIYKKYPSESLDGWTAFVLLKSGIEAKDVVLDRSDEYFNAASLRLSPPEDLVRDVLKSESKAFTPHDSWNVKGTRISLRKPEKRTALAGDDGSCKTLLSESCISALEEAAGKNWESDDPFTVGIASRRWAPRHNWCLDEPTGLSVLRIQDQWDRLQSSRTLNSQS